MPLAALLFVVSILFEPLRYEYEIIVSVHFAISASKARREAEIVFFKIFIYVACVLYGYFFWLNWYHHFPKIPNGGENGWDPLLYCTAPTL